MAIPKRKLVALCLSVAFITGCTSVKVVRNPDEGDTGVRFYRPKPYLLVTPADPTGRLVNMKLEYLPDFNEEYSAHLKGKASVALKDGWNLVGVNTKDAPKDKEEPPAKIEDIKLPPAVVSATNVPIGYYESVYGMSNGHKFLQGWRYIGMTVLGGGQPGICQVPGHNPNCPPGSPGAANSGCINGPLYGLVFFNGVMTFRQLDEIANNQLCPMYVNPTPAELPPTKPEPDTKFGSPGGNLPDTKLETPATPTPTPPGPTSLSSPRIAPALVVTKPILKPVVAAKPAPKATIPSKATTPGSIASSTPPLPTPAKATSTPRPIPAQDTLSGMPAGLDPDLFKTSSSPRP